MWGEGGRLYWGQKEEERRSNTENYNGIVVIYAWLSSHERNLKPFIDLYSSMGWISLVCHSEFLTLFFPEKATSLASCVLNELIKEIKLKQLPIVFASFSGGPKGCLYKVLQLMEGKCEGQPNLDDYQLVRDCICGQVFDSSPADFTSDLGTRFVLHPSVIKMSRPPKVATWIAKAIASVLDSLFINNFEAQRAEYWETLYSSVKVGPVLIFCSEDDELAPYPIVSNFANRLKELGGDVRLVKWTCSPHVGHYKRHPAEYKDAVTELLISASTLYKCRKQPQPSETETLTGSSKHICESICCLHKAAVTSNESLKRVAISPSDHFFIPSSAEYNQETKEGGSLMNEQRDGSFHVHSPLKINANGVLGKMLFNICVPKNVEDWDLEGDDLSVQNSHFNSVKCLRRSRL